MASASSAGPSSAPGGRRQHHLEALEAEPPARSARPAPRDLPVPQVKPEPPGRLAPKEFLGFPESPDQPALQEPAPRATPTCTSRTCPPDGRPFRQPPGQTSRTPPDQAHPIPATTPSSARRPHPRPASRFCRLLVNLDAGGTYELTTGSATAGNTHTVHAVVPADQRGNVTMTCRSDEASDLTPIVLTSEPVTGHGVWRP